jgi:hypothetical protein
MEHIEAFKKRLHDLLLEHQGDVRLVDHPEIIRESETLGLDKRQLSRLVQETHNQINYHRNSKEKEAAAKEEALRKEAEEKEIKKRHADLLLQHITTQCLNNEVFTASDVKNYFIKSTRLKVDENEAAEILDKCFREYNYVAAVTLTIHLTKKEKLESTDWVKKNAAPPPLPAKPDPRNSSSGGALRWVRNLSWMQRNIMLVIAYSFVFACFCFLFIKTFAGPRYLPIIDGILVLTIVVGLITWIIGIYKMFPDFKSRNEAKFALIGNLLSFILTLGTTAYSFSEPGFPLTPIYHSLYCDNVAEMNASELNLQRQNLMYILDISGSMNVRSKPNNNFYSTIKLLQDDWGLEDDNQYYHKLDSLANDQMPTYLMQSKIRLCKMLLDHYNSISDSTKNVTKFCILTFSRYVYICKDTSSFNQKEIAQALHKIILTPDFSSFRKTTNISSVFNKLIKTSNDLPIRDKFNPHQACAFIISDFISTDAGHQNGQSIVEYIAQDIRIIGEKSMLLHFINVQLANSTDFAKKEAVLAQHGLSKYSDTSFNVYSDHHSKEKVLFLYDNPLHTTCYSRINLPALSNHEVTFKIKDPSKFEQQYDYSIDNNKENPLTINENISLKNAGHILLKYKGNVADQSTSQKLELHDKSTGAIVSYSIILKKRLPQFYALLMLGCMWGIGFTIVKTWQYLFIASRKKSIST